MNSLKRVAVIGGLRLPFMRMGTQLAETDLLEMLTLVLQAMVVKYKLHGERLGEVALGTTFFHPQYWNISRDTVLRTELSQETPALGIQRACATSLEATITIANKIALGQIECGIAGGAESMSNVAMFLRAPFARRLVSASKAKSIGQKLSVWRGLKIRDILPATAPGMELSTGKSMGEHCEMMARTWHISREEQDELALKSHETGVAAFKSGFYDDLVIEYHGSRKDNNLRTDTSMEKLSKLKPAFDENGTLTAGNSSPFTDGASACLLASEDWAKKKGLPILAYIRDFETAAIDVFHEGLLMAPAYAMSRMLRRNKLKLQDFDHYEIHEAFTAQVLCTLKAWEDARYCEQKLGADAPLGPVAREKLNTKGGSVALGHPFGATGTRLVATLAKTLSEDKSAGARGVISICTGGGMGTVMILEKA